MRRPNRGISFVEGDEGTVESRGVEGWFHVQGMTDEQTGEY